MMLKVKSKLRLLAFFVGNLIALRKLVEIKSVESDGLMFRGYLESDAGSVSKIYQQLNGGAVFSWMQRKLFSRIGKRCFFVVEKKCLDGTSRIFGVNMYYLNNRDVQENTIHEGFIGVVPEASGRGIATKMRQIAICHFKSAGFSGVSTRISLENKASLVSAKKNGFRIVEEYEDPSSREQRYYMRLKF